MRKEALNALRGTAEWKRLQEIEQGVQWRGWGPYVSERQWGTVREDYSADGDAWASFPHDHARSRAYRWGEDAIAGFCNQAMRWCLGLALWNGKDPILKERLFGLTNAEGNHGEDVKEVYHYADAVPSHAYQRMVYRYPHAAFPYDELLRRNAERGLGDPEFELSDTGVLDDERYFDVTVEYAKASPFDILMRVTVCNAAAEMGELHVLPQLTVRNSWSWGRYPGHPRLRKVADGALLAERPKRKPRRLDVEGPAQLLFCENETNVARLYGVQKRGPFKDGINDFVVHGRHDAVSFENSGTKAAAVFRLQLPPGGSACVRLRLSPDGAVAKPFDGFDALVEARRREADEFYAAIQADIADAGVRSIHRQALAGMLWSKQIYLYNVPEWLDGDPTGPPPPLARKHGRNGNWRHLNNFDVVSMPDKWEYPWYAAWDLAFHCVTLATIDPGFAKTQLTLLTREWFMHPNGQLPAYEWDFGDVNPPVHAWAAWRVYETDRQLTGKADRAFLERVLHKLMLNFTWWVNRKDAGGRNVFQGGFLGLDNIGLFNRSAPVPGGGTIDQADGTAWMAMYSLNLLRIAVELAYDNPVYEDIATKFFEHFLAIAEAMTNMGNAGMGLWDEEGTFFYDVLSFPDGRRMPLRVRSLVGLIPMLAVEVLEPAVFERLPEFTARLRWFLDHRPDLAGLVSRWHERGKDETNLLSLLRGHRLKCLLRWILDEKEFLSPHGVRSVSKAHHANPVELTYGSATYRVDYEPGESTSRLFGGNSNWRGPVWMPINYMLIDAIRRFHAYYGDDFLVEYPVGSTSTMTLAAVADELTRRLLGLFRPDASGVLASIGSEPRQKQLAIGDHLLFHEYFHGDTGRGLGASHQTGWTGLIANLARGA